MSDQQPHADASTSDHEQDESRRSPPPPPIPSADPGLLERHDPAEITSHRLAVQNHEIFEVTPLAALKLLSAGVEALVRMTGDIPPTPPPTSPTVPHMRGMQAEKENIVRSHSEMNLARLAAGGSNSPRPGTPRRSPLAEGSSTPAFSRQQPVLASMPAPAPAAAIQHQPFDGVHLRTPNPPPTQTPSPNSEPDRPEPYIIIGANSQPLNLQHSAITRKFYSKLPPPISVTDYLLRMHTFCPMSTAVYLATSLYIHRLAVAERAIVVTRRNSHRLLLAGLRVAMKALEDLSYPHSKMARVGGVSEAELARLEISFCFLAGFELVVGEDALTEQWQMLRSGQDSWGKHGAAVDKGFGALRLGRRPKQTEG